MWYQRLFGDTRSFAIRVELEDDPHPAAGADPRLVASWGRLAIWADGRCLTQAVLGADTVVAGVEWYLLPFLEWASLHILPLTNEEPFPLALGDDELPHATAWHLAAEEPPLTLLDQEETEWFVTRSQWWTRHALRAAFPGAAAPAIVFRRLDDAVEISWDNETWAPPRPDLRFTEGVGTLQVDGQQFGRILQAVVTEVADALKSRLGDELELHGATPRPDTWEYLLPEYTTAALKSDAVENEALLETLRARSLAHWPFVPHSPTTTLLRDSGAASREDVQRVLRLGTTTRQLTGTLAPELIGCRAPRRAPTHRPWVDGYDAALEVREALGWDGQPVPQLDTWLTRCGVEVDASPLPARADGAAVWWRERRPVANVNPRGRRARRASRDMMLATDLGHLLLDARPDEDFALVHGVLTHWPSAARARAFAAMFLMPESGIRAHLEGHDALDADALVSLMRTFGASASATTWHLKNLGLVSDSRRVELVEEVARRADGSAASGPARGD